MKNKKLFAILTLVCFMFTLMPVAAFAAYNADVKANQYVVKVDDGDGFVEDVTVVADPVATVTVEAYKGTDALTGVQGAAYYVVNADGKAVQIAYDEELNGEAFTIKAPGTYTVYGVIDNPQVANTELATLVGSANSLTSDVSVADAVAKIEAKLAADIIRTAATVTVEAAEAVYSITATAPEGAINADGGFTDAGTKVVTVTIMNGTQPVVGKTPTIVAPDYLTVTPANPKKAVTNAAGVIQYKVSANKSGSFEVVFGYEDAEEDAVSIVVNKGDIKNVEVVKEPATLINNAYNADGIKTGAVVKFTDADGAMISVATSTSALQFNATGLNKTDGVLSTQVVKAAVVAQPATSKLTAANLELVPSTTEQGAFELVVKSASALKVGSYQVRFALANNDYATVAFEAAKMGDVVGIRFVQPATTIASGAESLPTFTVQAYDAKGVTETLDAEDYTVSFQGKALDGAGVSDEEKYIGSTITVLAKTTNNKFVATTTLEVVAGGNEVVYANTTAEVGVTTQLKANVVDTKGNKVAVDAEDTMSIVVLDKPANAYVNAAVTGVTNGKDINVTFLASVAGEYKIQTIIVDEDTDRFVTGIATIVVGGNEVAFDDVVVISIGATKMIVNDTVVTLDVAPYIENSRTMMQYNVLGAFGFDIQWVQETRSVVAEGNGIKVVMTIGEKVATVNGEEVTLDVAPQIVNGRTVVPVGFLTGTFGINNQIIKAADGSVADILFTK